MTITSFKNRLLQLVFGGLFFINSRTYRIMLQDSFSEHPDPLTSLL